MPLGEPRCPNCGQGAEPRLVSHDDGRYPPSGFYEREIAGKVREQRAALQQCVSEIRFEALAAWLEGDIDAETAMTNVRAAIESIPRYVR
jgi:hypothetical protein